MHLRALTLVVTLVLSLSGAATAQVVPETGDGLLWTSVNNCPLANTFGPQVYSDMETDQPNTEAALLQLDWILARCYQATVSSAGQNAANALATVLQMIAALAQRWHMMHYYSSASTSSNPQTRRTAPPVRQTRYLQGSVGRYIPPRAPVPAPRIAITVPSRR